VKIIGIVGSRRRSTQEDFGLVRDAFIKVYQPGDAIVSGGCPVGGDRFAEDIASDMQIPITIYNAAWKIYGRSAGHKRNTFIAADADVLIACVAYDRTGGTEDTIRKYSKTKNLLILV
jgi:hypothetical protein